MKANGVEQKVSVTPEKLGAVFQASLPRGRNQLHGWFLDAEGQDLCGAFYALVTKLS